MVAIRRRSVSLFRTAIPSAKPAVFVANVITAADRGAAGAAAIDRRFSAARTTIGVLLRLRFTENINGVAAKTDQRRLVITVAFDFVACAHGGALPLAFLRLTFSVFDETNPAKIAVAFY